MEREVVAVGGGEELLRSETPLFGSAQDVLFSHVAMIERTQLPSSPKKGGERGGMEKG